MQGPLEYEIHYIECVKSTNTTLKELAKRNASEGYVLIASEQTNGRGRMNRVFYSPKGTGLYCSILLRPKIALPPASLTCMAAAAVSETIEEFDVPCKIKWVNDVYVHEKKAVGILTEGAYKQDGTYAYAVVGIGVNLFHPNDGFPKQVEEIATSVFSTALDEEIKKRFIKRLLYRFKQYYEQLPQTPFYQVYCEKQMIIGKPILFSDTDGMKRGTAIGIDEEFRLVVQTSDGETHSLERGEVTVM